MITIIHILPTNLAFSELLKAVRNLPNRDNGWKSVESTKIHYLFNLQFVFIIAQLNATLGRWFYQNFRFLTSCLITTRMRAQHLNVSSPSIFTSTRCKLFKSSTNLWRQQSSCHENSLKTKVMITHVQHWGLFQ